MIERHFNTTLILVITKFTDGAVRLFAVFAALLRGQILIFPRVNSIKLRVYGKVTIRGYRRNVVFGRGVIFLGDATIVCGYDAPSGRISIEDNVIFEHNCYLNAHGGYINISREAFIGVSAIIQGKGGVNIGSNTMLGPNVQLYSSDHQYKISNTPFSQQPELSDNICIGSNVWIGANSIILKGSDIHPNSVVAACSLVKLKTDRPALISNSECFASVRRELIV